MCRFRGLNEREKQYDTRSFMKLLEDGKTVIAKNRYDSGIPLTFSFDRVFTPETPQSVVYDVAGKPIIESVLKGFNGTILAYGQTSSGKTYTMTGPDTEDNYYKGIIPRTIQSIFSQIQDSSDEIEYTIKLSYCEIYLERIRDLLHPSKGNLRILEDRLKGIYIENLTEQYVSQSAEVEGLMKLGNNNRKVAQTKMNTESSRSHAILLFTVSQSHLVDLSARTGKLYLVDLAGSEKVSKTKAKGKRLDEAKKINQSLSALGLVIKALTDGKSSHVPYRDSKLTRILQESLGGNSLTCLIVACSAAKYNEHETLSTLRFGVRAKAIKNNPKVNRELTIPELKLLLTQSKEEITEKHLRILLLEQAIQRLGGTVPEADGAVDDSNKYQDLLTELHREKRRFSEEAELTSSLKGELSAETTAKEELAQERERLNDRIVALTLAGNVREDSLLDLTDKTQNLEREIEILNMQIKQLADCNAQLEEKLAAKDRETEAVSFTSSELKDFNTIREELGELRGKYAIQLELTRSKSIVHSETEESLSETTIDQEKNSLVNELRTQRHVSEQLENDLNSVKKQLGHIEETRNSERLVLKQKTNILEANMNHLTMLYQQQVGNNDLSKNQVKVYEDELDRKNTMIEKLLGQLTQAKDAVRSYRSKVESLQETDLPKKLRGIKKVVRGGTNPRLLSILSGQVYDISN